MGIIYRSLCVLAIFCLYSCGGGAKEDFNSDSTIVDTSAADIEPISNIEEECQLMINEYDSINKLSDENFIAINNHEDKIHQGKIEDCSFNIDCKTHKSLYDKEKSLKNKLKNKYALIEAKLIGTSKSFKYNFYEKEMLYLKNKLNNINLMILNHNNGRGDKRCNFGEKCKEHKLIFEKKISIQSAIDNVEFCLNKI
jgi:hypothetical protein